MNLRALIYTVVLTIAVSVVAGLLVGLYRNGSPDISGWTKAFSPGPLSQKHAFLADNCETCHSPLDGVKAASCIACHAPAATELSKQSTAFHAIGRDCRGCHLEHLGGVRPTKMDHTFLLRIAEPPQGWFMPSAIEQIKADLQGFLMLAKSEDREKAVLECVSCHSNRDPHRGLFGKNCADCHELGSWRVAGFLHPSPRSKDCAQCHQAPPSHYMEHFSMIDKMVTGQEHAAVTQCYQCHRTDSFNDIKNIGWYKHH
ncbi:MAG: cytochrome c3 family protein [Rhodopseudomonas palustris]|uniref:Cytochrome c3 family protein n=1 Tax=Rhodopseudomonas palustris TaxID=1076 RepID=A0A933RVC1_RHOPL|nr:cytochrome c3 family protein [Rhodopseudomonas palustris]